ncbi:sigma 54-interacting transcriptional regulator [Ramlibacter terrae]|uniref:Sigma 54-interacting transcriptional regulator n=1 Tax=Ramlibacter terrae TaxID=2732511 RepID=A0ABX6P6A6_9BURK|nr:sigma 54-interacting transcriptional regulator [Ramlibacter terrae]
MSGQSWLIAWIGKTDHEAAEGKLGKDVGPIATALTGEPRYSRIYLLTNYDFARSKRFCAWLEKTTGYDSKQVDLYQVDLESPIDYAGIYAAVSANLKGAGLPREDVELTFHLSPGTPAMAAIWIILSKTRFPAKLIQTSRERGLEPVNFFFDLASDFLPEFLQRSGERITRLAEGAKELAPAFDKIIHRSTAIRQQIELARRIAVLDVPVLVLGETGTGKELFAEAIHAASPRSAKPFIAVNCGAIAPELASSELFGHKRGAFTSAVADRKGHFREADGGTLFLDEVGDLPLDTQVRLLRALQTGEVTLLGASKPVKVNVRIVAATHRDLASDVAAGRFREDLFHRLAVGILRLPPLRERDQDAAMLIEHFLAQINADAKGRPEAQEKKLSEGAKKVLQSYEWPGNIRELYHTLVRAAIWSKGPSISAEDAQAALLQIRRQGDTVLGRPLTQGFDLKRILDEVARDYIARALKQSGDRKTVAAELLGFPNYQTFGNWMKRLGVDSTD